MCWWKFFSLKIGFLFTQILSITGDQNYQACVQQFSDIYN